MKHHAVVLTLALGACVGGMEDVSVVELALARDQCNPMGCGTNSPHVGNWGFTDLHMDGLPNAAKLKIERFEKPGTMLPYKMSVVGGRIFGRNPLGHVVTDGDLKGMRIWLRHVDTDQQVVIQIFGYGETPYWADNGANQFATTYLLGWDWGNGFDTKESWKNVCKSASAYPQDTRGMSTMLAVVFEGDRIDPVKKTVGPVTEKRWFNIGCAGNALAKLHLTGHTAAARIDAGFETTVDQRQTMLKMLTADYCGSGKAFTVAGQEVDWTDDKGWMKYLYPEQEVEAHWTRDGAKCLNVPRMIANPQYATSWWTSMEIEKEIANECDLSPCGDDPDGYHLVSANPVLP